MGWTVTMRMRIHLQAACRYQVQETAVHDNLIQVLLPPMVIRTRQVATTQNSAARMIAATVGNNQLQVGVGLTLQSYMILSRTLAFFSFF